MTASERMTVSAVALAFDVSESTVKRRIRVLKKADNQSYAKYISTTGKGQKVKYLIDRSYAHTLIAVHNVTDKVNADDRQMTDKKSDVEVEWLRAELQKAAENQKQLVELMEKQQDQAHSERSDLNKRLSESNALQLHLQNQLKATSDQLQLLRSATEEEAQIESSSSKPANYAWLVLALFIFIVLAALIVNMANGAW